MCNHVYKCLLKCIPISLSTLAATLSVILSLLQSSVVHALGTSATQLQGKLRFAIADGPPHVRWLDKSGPGIDIPQLVFRRMGYQLEFRDMSYSRAHMELKSGRVDMAAPVSQDHIDGIYLSDSHFFYRPMAFSLKSRSLSITNIHDLKNFRLCTYQGAAQSIGQDFSNVADSTKEYIELTHMGSLPKVLLADRTDVVIMDYYLYRHFESRARRYGIDLDKLITVHDVFTILPARIAFNNPQIRDKFNQGLSDILDDGSYQELMEEFWNYVDSK